MTGIRLTARVRTVGRRLAVLSVLTLLGVSALVVLAAPAAAAPLTGGFSPTIVSGEADLNGDGVANGRDDANAFYGDTHIIDGMLDCNAWGPIANAGDAGDETIDGDDDCSLVGYDGTPDGVTIEVVGGAFQVANGPLPTVFNTADPDNPDVGDSDFAWSAIDGRVDANGDEDIDGDDCHFGVRARPSMQASATRRMEPTSSAIRGRTSAGSRLRRTLPTTGSWTSTVTPTSRRPTRARTAASSAST